MQMTLIGREMRNRAGASEQDCDARHCGRPSAVLRVLVHTDRDKGVRPSDTYFPAIALSQRETVLEKKTVPGTVFSSTCNFARK